MTLTNRKLLVGVVIYGLLALNLRFVDRGFNGDNFYYLANWAYWLAMVYGIGFMVYLYRLSCPNCGAKRIVRDGLNALAIRWPSKSCHACREKID